MFIFQNPNQRDLITKITVVDDTITVFGDTHYVFSSSFRNHSGNKCTFIHRDQPEHVGKHYNGENIEENHTHLRFPSRVNKEDIILLMEHLRKIDTDPEYVKRCINSEGQKIATVMIISGPIHIMFQQSMLLTAPPSTVFSEASRQACLEAYGSYLQSLEPVRSPHSLMRSLLTAITPSYLRSQGSDRSHLEANISAPRQPNQQAKLK